MRHAHPRRTAVAFALASALAAALGAATRGQEAPTPTAAPPADPELARAEALNERITALYGEGKYREALPLAREVLAIRERALGEDHPDVGTSLNNLALLLKAQGAYAEARPLAERALAIREQALGKDHADVAQSLNDLATLLKIQGAHAEARPLYERALAIREKVLGKGHPDVAESLNDLALLLTEQGAHAEARPLHERALGIREKARGKDHPDVAQSLNNLALLLKAQGAYAEARPLFERALAVWEKALGKDDPEVATSLNNLAALLKTQGAYAEARPLYERALAIREKAFGTDHPDVAQSLNNLALLLTTQGAYAEARPLFERAIAIRARALGEDHPAFANVLNNLAALLQNQGAYDEARPLFERALAIREKALGKDHTDVATSLENLASLLTKQGAYDEARPLFERALAIRQKALGKDHPDVADSLNSLAHLLRAQGAYDEARPLFERALAIREKALGKDHTDVAASLNNLAAVLQNQGAYDEARPLYERALATWERALGSEHPDVAVGLHNLARLSQSEGALAKARTLYQRALAIREKALGKDHPLVALSLESLARALEAGAAPGEARPLLERALTIRESNALRFFGGLTPPQRVLLTASTRSTLDAFLGLVASPGETGYDAALRFKGLVARVGEVERRALAAADPGTRALAGERRAAQAWLARLAQSPPTDAAKRARWQEDYAKAAARCEALALELGRRSAAVREASDRLRLGPKDIQAHLREGEALVDLLRYGDRYAAWIVRRDGPVERVELGRAAGVTATAGPIEAAAARFRQAARDAPDPSSRELLLAGAALRELVWGPIEARLGDGVTTVYLAPDAALAAVPFAALPGRGDARPPGGGAGTREGPERFLIDERTLVYLATAQDLVPWTTEVRRGEGALAIGAVDFERAEPGLPAPETGTSSVVALARAGDTPAGSVRAPTGSRFAPLPATGPEVEAVLAHARAAAPTGTAIALRGPQATEAALRAFAPGRRLVHIAAHGFVRHDLRSALDRPAPASGTAARDEPLAPGLERHLSGYDPMLLSGLALAGANARAGGGDDDGILTASEAAGLDLDGVDLVTLSACDTAGGDVRAGEGVLGLVRGFREAGARCVVASLWPVDDEATRRLMGRLYAAALARDAARPPALALREAAAALRVEEVEVLDERASSIAGREVRVRRRAFAPPRYWAAFVAYGPIR